LFNDSIVACFTRGDSPSNPGKPSPVFKALPSVVFSSLNATLGTSEQSD